MDIKNLLTPYSENGRTIEGQIKWLLSKGIPQEHVDKAILAVYDEVDRGRVFKDGTELDHELLRVAKGHHEKDVSQKASDLEAFFNRFKDKWAEEMQAQARPTRWQLLKAFFRGRL